MQAPTDHGCEWRFAGRVWQPQSLPRLMGILNVTPDSFSDGGLFHTLDAAVERGCQLEADGADVLDVGGESTRPTSAAVDVEEELQRVIPVIERLSRLVRIPISIDTTKAEVARQALDAGASIVNDISGGLFDPQLIPTCADSDCGLILMHMQGTPRTMQDNPHYEDVVAEVRQFLADQVALCVRSGVARERIMIDPGIGFGKTADHNLELLRNIKAFRDDGRPVLIGHSRKRFLYKLLGRETDERLAGTIGVSLALAMHGTDMLRIHDVRAVRDALRTWEAVRPESNGSVSPIE